MYIIHSPRNYRSVVPLMYDATYNPKAFILLNYQEWQYNSLGDNPSFENIVDYVNDKNIPLYIVNGSVSEIDLIDINNPRYKNIVFERFPYFVLWHNFKAIRMDSNYKKYFDNLYIEPVEHFEHHYISMNNKAHEHRCRQMDILAQHDLLKYGAVSWNSWYGYEGRTLSESLKYDWKYWKPEILVLDNLKEGEMGWANQLPPQFETSFMQLISETNTKALIYSEKIAFSLIRNKLFLVSGPANYHSILKDWGFELYDEIFDYSFDTIVDDELRFQALTQNLIKLKEYDNNTLQNFYKIMKDKLIHNKKKFLELSTDISLIPKLLTDLFESEHPDVQDNEIGVLKDWYYEYKNNRPIFFA